MVEKLNAQLGHVVCVMTWLLKLIKDLEQFLVRTISFCLTTLSHGAEGNTTYSKQKEILILET